MTNPMLKNPFSPASALFNALWARDLRADPAWKASIFLALRGIYVIVRDLAGGQLTLRAMSLVYTTLLSIVPLLAFSFSVLKGFGVHNQVEPMLLNLLAPLGEKGIEIATQIVRFVENMKVGVLGSLGFALLIYTVISLMQKIENAFNYTWHVSQHRRVAQRFSDYLSVILIGPILIFTSLGISASVMSAEIVEQIASIQPIGVALELAGRIVPFLLSVAAFTFVYVFIPNTKVQIKSAFIGALVAGILWKLVGWVFAEFIVTSTKYAAIYSAFATLIFFMIWLYLSWIILMIGAAVAFYHQHPEYLTFQQGERRLSSFVKDKLALLVMQLVGERFYRREPAWTVEKLALRTNAPMEAMSAVLDALEDGGLLTRTTGDDMAYMPARPLETMPIKDVLDAIHAADEKGYIERGDIRSSPTVDSLNENIDEALRNALEGRTVRDLASAEPTAELTEFPSDRPSKEA
jgi:membrane protein